MKTLLILLSVCVVATVCSVPAQCIPPSGVLEVDDSLSADTNGYCDPRYTCELNCPCGKSLYFDLRPARLSCNSDPVAWAQGEIRKIEFYDFPSLASQLGGDYNQNFNKLRNMYNGQVSAAIHPIIYHFAEICKSGKQIPRSVADQAKQTIAQMASSTGDPAWSMLARVTQGLVDRIYSKFNQNFFRYCNCNSFKSRFPHISTTQLCNKACNAATAVEEVEEILFE